MNPLADLDVAVIGGGISGLTAAYFLKQSGRRVAVLEAAKTPGGCIGTVASGPYVADRGPQTFAASPPLMDLVLELELDGAFARSDRAGAKRYIYRHGKLNALPGSLGGFLSTPLLSTAGKWRLLMEPFVRRMPPGDVDESIAAFAQRRGGHELVAAVVAPVVGGIFAGDPARLSVQSAAPALRELEQAGSVLVGLARRMRVASGQRAAAGFIQGSRTLVYALARALGDDLHAGVRVRRLSQKGAVLALECDGLPEAVVEARRVLLAVPAPVTAELLAFMEPDAAEALRGIETPPIAQLVLAYPRAAIGVPLDGFGFLACRDEGVRLLGAVWNSVLFPDRCPSDELLVTAFFGGALDPGIADCSDEDLARVAHADLSRTMKINLSCSVPSERNELGCSVPSEARILPKVVAGFRWDSGIPQYNLGHAEQLARLHKAMSRLPGVRVIGNFLRGPSVSDCILLARETAAEL